MFETALRQAPLPTWVLRDGETSADLVPARGGLVSRFQVGSETVIAPDDEAVYGGTGSVRGGIPILFPIAGRLRDDRYSVDGVAHEMKQHGFARNMPWRVAGHDTERAARLVLELVSTSETLRVFPWDFRLVFTYEVAAGALRIVQFYENFSPRPMPLHAGFHPYFFVPDSEKAATRLETRATRAWDNVAKREIAFQGFDLTLREVDIHLLDHGESRSRLTRPGLAGAIEIGASQELSRWVVWTLAGRDFVCVEPWTAPADALNTGTGLLWLNPGERLGMTLEIRLAGT